MSGRRLATGASVLALVFATPSLRAGEIYKTIDANGNVTYSDHADPSSAKTSIVELQDPRYPPHEMHFCWTNCFTLIYDGQQYRRADGTDETWTVTKFTADSFVLHRHSAPEKWNGFSTDVTYTGHTANDRLVGVTVNGAPTSGIDASWGIALNTLPGSNAERDAARDPARSVQSAPAAANALAAGVAVAPPPLIDDLQAAADQDGYLWTPGYWNWGNTGYVWVPGAWVRPPAVGLLWTPGYWSFVDGRYVFHPGYWGRRVGFYGGINYGFGYFGTGYVGGHWVGNNFAYNSLVNHLTPGAVANSYAEAIPSSISRTRVSYNGGPGGSTAIATDQERLATADAHFVTATAHTAPHSGVDRPAPNSVKEPPQEAAIPEVDAHRQVAPKNTTVSPRLNRPSASKAPGQPN